MEHRKLGQYTLEDLLGAGGMGEVYRAHDTVRDRRVALKVLPEAFSHDHEYSSRFRREQHIAARLRDPHIIPIHDFGEIDGRLFIDMRMVDGRDLSHLLAEGPLPPDRAVHLVDQAAQALDSAHAEGLVHRDIKPSNLLVTPSGFVYVVDFGIARKVGTTRTSLTVTGATVGTLDYMAPERFTTAPLDARADVYSLACLMYECLTAQRPFPGHDLPTLMYAHFYTEAQRPSDVDPALPAALDEVVLRGMAKNPDERFATAGEMATAAHEALGGRALLAASWTPAPAPRAAAGAAAGAAAAAAAEAAARHREQTRAGKGDDAVIDLRDGGATQPTQPAPVTPAPGGMGLVVAGGAHRTVDPLPTAALSTGRRTTDQRAADPLTVFAAPSDGTDGRVHAFAPAPTQVPTPAPDPVDAPTQAPPGPARAWSTHDAAAPAAPQAPAARPAPPQARFGHDPGGDGGYGNDSGNGPGGAAPAPPAPRRRRRGLLALAVVAACLVVAIVATGAWLYFDPLGGRADATDTVSDQTGSDPSTAPSPTEAVAPAASVAIPSVGDTIPVGDTPGFIEVTPNGRFAYIASRDAGVVTVIDTAVNQVTAKISIDAGPPQFLSFSPDGRTAFVSIYKKSGDTYTDNYVAFLDTATNDVTATIPVGQRPFASATTPDGTLLYVPSHDTGKLDVIDVAQQKVVQEIPVAPNPHWVAFGKDGSTIYTANHESGVVTVIKASDNSIVTTIPVGKAPHSTAVSPDGTRVSVVNYDSNELSVIDTATNTVVATVPLDTKPQDVAYAPDGHYIYTANVDAGTVNVIDATSNRLTASVPVGGHPTSISILPNGTTAYVTLLDEGLVRMLDLDG